LVAIAVDTVSSRLQKAIFGAKDIVEVTIKSPAAEPIEKPLREHLDKWVRDVAAKPIRGVCFDTPLQGDAFAKLMWTDKRRLVHAYDEAGQVSTTETTEYEGPTLHVIPAGDVVYPEGFDYWADLPWMAHRQRYTKAELLKNARKGVFAQEKVDKILGFAKERDDPRHKVTSEAAHRKGRPSLLYEIYELYGLFEVPEPKEDAAVVSASGVPGATTSDSESAAEDSTEDPKEIVWEECIIWYHQETRTILNAVYNPYFGKARHFVKIPYLVQNHEVAGLGIAEMVLQFQEGVSATINQQIDAATAANAGILVCTPGSNWGENNDVYPGKRVVTDNPTKDVTVVRLSEPSPNLGGAAQFMRQLSQERSGVSAYNLGMESGIVGSQATATGTTAIIGEGNIRFWVSVEDFRSALEELIYLMLQQEQQFRPEGIDIPGVGKMQLPQGDLKAMLGLKINITSEKVNRELEIQNFQMLMQLLNDYYARFMQAAAMIANPQFPPMQKILAIQVMTGAQNIVKRIVERFDIENTDVIVPDLMMGIQQAIGMLSGQAAVAGGPPAGPQALPGGAQGPPGQAPPPGNGGGPGPGGPPAPGGGPIA
jgi:hypothetical protein